ncbi:enoyl-CoA hydratase-related protein [Variovorax guangxiensis]|uniref:enoyl-CoA hydratase-related protein n=1 Tax=Variovorax guangxiensis TaxID=1775474 RepID=UPI00286499C8|nr:enoyl-CoA hydratase-related protein [Variovorax guangxiensis]MDR6855867.1 enoyl-CoA hydratase/carnithine racemase [Variovorax guangxiensis]
MTTVVKESRQNGRLVLTIDRPERRNALNADVIAALQDALHRAKADPTVRAVVLTGAGEEAFCAGADLGADAFALDYATPTIAYADLLRTARTLTVPLVARVNGACMAGGMGLLAMCDLALAAPRAIFGLPEAKIGVFPMQVLAVLQAQVPQRCLAQLCLTGDPIDAARAREIGLVNEVADDLDGALERLLARLQANSPTALRRGLYAMKAMGSMSFEEAIAFGEGQIGLLAITQDAREGIAAFKEKRRPQWTGK